MIIGVSTASSSSKSISKLGRFEAIAGNYMDILSEVCLHESKELIELRELAAYSPPLCITAEPLCCLIFILLETNLRCKFTASLNVILPERCKHIFTP